MVYAIMRLRQNRTFHVGAVNAKTLVPIVQNQINTGIRIGTDEAGRNEF